MKEEIVNSVLELNDGDFIVAKTLNRDMFGCVSSVGPSLRYSFSDSTGRKKRSLGRDANNQLKFVYADDEGCIGDEEIKCVGITMECGDLTLNEDDDLTDWNIRKVDKTHPKYNKDVAEHANMFSKVMNMFGDFSGMFNKD